MLSEKAIEIIERGTADAIIREVIGVPSEELSAYKNRLVSAINKFSEIYGKDRDISVFSVGGRSEISGNHTDHNGGKVIAAAVNPDIIAVASARSDEIIKVKSEGFSENVVLPGDEKSPDPEKRFNSTSLVAGVKHAFVARGLAVGGFDAYTTSDILKGSGLSSSAAFEVMIGKIFSSLFNLGNVDYKEIAKSAQYAENVFYGKPCGLMDQMACAAGGLISIDFSKREAPDVRNIEFDFSKSNYAICITNTGSSHVDMNDDYASVPGEMKSIASYFSKTVLSEVTRKEVESNLSELRTSFGDRAVLRTLHFYDENERVDKQIAALESGNFEDFLDLVNESGKSSFCYLQNVYSSAEIKAQGTSLAIYLTEKFLAGKGAVRIQGGGFAGTIEAFVPADITNEYKEYMERVFGAHSCRILSVRPAGAVKII